MVKVGPNWILLLGSSTLECKKSTETSFMKNEGKQSMMKSQLQHVVHVVSLQSDRVKKT